MSTVGSDGYFPEDRISALERKWVRDCHKNESSRSKALAIMNQKVYRRMALQREHFVDVEHLIEPNVEGMKMSRKVRIVNNYRYLQNEFLENLRWG